MSAPQRNTVESSRRSEIRAEVATASRMVAPLWPIGTFIAVNPLGGMLDRPFEDAVRAARREMGASGYLPLDAFRSLHASGRITDSQLESALTESLPDLESAKDLELGSRTVKATEILMADLLHSPEEEAGRPASTAAARCDSMLGTDIAGTVDSLVADWVAGFTDTDGAAWSMPRNDSGLYSTFRELAAGDPRLRAIAGGRLRLALAETPEEAISAALLTLRIPRSRQVDELRAQLLRLPGWAGYSRWRSEWAAADVPSPPLDPVNILAVRLTAEALGVSDALQRAQLDPDSEAWISATPADLPDLPADQLGRLESVSSALGLEPDSLSPGQRAQILATLARIGPDDRLAIWLRAHERGYRDGLLTMLSAHEPPATTRSEPARPAAQVVFCIDVRSEGMRRHLESAGSFETLGFAGFFAVAIRFRSLGAAAPSALCPVLLSPAVDVEEVPAPGKADAAARALEARSGADAFAHAFHGAKRGVASPFALAEGGGLLAGPLAAFRTFAVGTRARIRDLIARPLEVETRVTETADSDGGPGFSLDEQVLFGHAALTMMGLTEGFARLVVLCAHGSHTENNPYAAALDCGACGGQQGGPNARVAAAILNRPEVRSELVSKGIEIPPDTWFVAAEHDTTSDSVEILDAASVPADHADDLASLRTAFAKAGESLRAERADTLPGARNRGGLESRGRDWAQIRPEWGLAGNAAFIVGPRETTAGLDLGCRTFLHSYRAEHDPDGSALEVILTAPLVVAQWINSQYYFSSVDPDLFGAGDKTLLNVTGAGGVVQGGGGDLRVGLPWQSVAVGNRLQHEPLRLLAVVEAPIGKIDELIGRNTILQEMFNGGWVRLAARESATAQWQERSRAGTWSPWRPIPAAREQDPNRRTQEVAAS